MRIQPGKLLLLAFVTGHRATAGEPAPDDTVRVVLSATRPAPAADPVQVAVNAMNKTSSGPTTRLTLRLTVSGSPAKKALGTRWGTVHWTDGKGLELTDPPPGLISFHNATVQAHETLDPSLSFASESFDFSFIKSVQGEIELYQPNGIDGSTVEIPGFRSFSGKAIPSEGLAKNGLKATWLDRKSFDALQTKIGAVMLNGPQAETDFDRDIVLYVEDPKRLVVGLVLRERDGSVLWGQREVHRSFNEHADPNGFIYVLRPRIFIPTDVQLVIYLSVPGTWKSYPFRLEHIAVP